MSFEFTPNEDIKRLIDQIIVKNDVKKVQDVEYRQGSQSGDGYVSKTVAVDIIHEDGTLNLFLKYAQDLKSSENMPLDKFYTTEIYFYDVVYPAFLEFTRNKQAEGLFHHAPKCYGTSEKSGIVALENLRLKGFSLWDRMTVMDRPHLELVLRTFARFHAVSFAFKDQQREKYQELVDKSSPDFFSKMVKTEGGRAMFTADIEMFLKGLDPVRDKHLVDKSANLVDRLIEVFAGPARCSDDYSILTQGDCWCTNMMFLYPDENSKNPQEVVLIDWQLLRKAAPVFDVSYFFYTIASEEALNDIDRYLRIYHSELSERIRELGSDPEVLYPFHVLQQQWKEYGRFGFALAFRVTRGMLAGEDEVVNMEGVNFENPEEAKKFSVTIRREDEFLKRMKLLFEHIIANDWL